MRRPDEAPKLDCKVLGMFNKGHLRCYIRKAKSGSEIASVFDIPNFLEDVKENAPIIQRPNR